MKIVLDSNIYISSFVFGGNARLAFDYSFLAHEVFISEFILLEIRRVLKNKFRLSEDKLHKITNTLLIQAQKVQIVGEIPSLCRDKDDNNILWLAESCNADLIITGDKDLLTLINFKGIKIMHPAEFIQTYK